MRISRSAIAVGGVVLAAGVIGFTNPKTVHAVAAALVEVTNTPSNPVPTADVGRSASQIVEIWCVVGNPCYLVEPSGSVVTTGAYAVPSGQSLVITNIQIQAPSRSGTSSFATNLTLGGGVSPIFVVPNDGTTHLFQLSPGIVRPSGETITADGDEGLTVYLYGYLTSN